MMDGNAKFYSPYVGLVPFSEEDAPFFFGRHREVELVKANLRGSPLTVFYGASGVGKSSILRAGVLHQLTELARRNLEIKGTPEFAVAIFSSWSGDLLTGLADSIHQGILKAHNIKALERVPVPTLKEMLEITTRRFGVELLIILDQFEEYFQYYDDDVSKHNFAEELPDIIKGGLRVRFLISLREDMLSRLDFFKGRIPGLFSNRLLVEALDIHSAREAIERPISAYNDVFKPDTRFSIEAPLVDQVVKQVATERFTTYGTEGTSRTESSYIDCTYLQLVMTRIWDEEVESHSSELRESTLRTLGGVKTVVGTHVDSVMAGLSQSDQRIAAECLNYLATPIGTKIALTAAMLAKWTGEPETRISPVLERLVAASPRVNARQTADPAVAASREPKSRPARILRPVEIKVGNSRYQGYEVLHDALIPALSNWRLRYLRIELDSRARRNFFIGMAMFILIFILLGGIGYREWKTAKSESGNLAKENKSLTNKTEEADQQAAKALSEQSSAVRSAKSNQEIIEALTELGSRKQGGSAQAVDKFKELASADEIPEDLKPKIEDIVRDVNPKQLRNVTDAIRENPDQDTNSQPRIYIHIQNEDQRAKAREIQTQLRAAKFIAPGIQDLNFALSASEVRYFRHIDEDSANRVKSILQTAGVKDIKVRFIPGYENSTSIRPLPLEIWFAANAFAEPEG